jgi:RNA polymerase sigma factor (sigma-70 family)
MAAVPSIGRATAVTRRPASRGAVATHDLYERYAKQIHTFCLHQLGNREEAEDATQSTFLNAFRGLERGVEPEFESAWLFKIAHNVCLTRQRSSFRRRRVESPGDLDAIQDLLPSPQRDADELIRLTDALHGMPEQQRKALLLREWQGLSYKEIADELELSQPAVETLLFRARRSLAQGLTEEPKKEKGLRKRLRTGGDMGSLAALVKTLFFGGSAKVAATVATVAATSVVAATPAVRHDVAKLVGPAPAEPAAAHVPTTVAPAANAPALHTVAPAVQRAQAADVVRPVAAAPTRTAKPKTVATPPAIAGGHVKGASAHTTPPPAPPAPAATTPVAPAAEPAPAPAPAEAEPAPEPAREPAATTHGPPATPPGQAKKADERKDAPEPASAAASTPNSAPPGQAKTDEGKKDERKGASAQAAAPASPGQAKKDERKKDNGKKDDSTLQPQQQTQAQPQQQLQAAPAAAAPVQAPTPPGQAKKADKDRRDQPAPVVTTPVPTPTPPPAPAAPAPAPAADPVPAPAPAPTATDDAVKGKNGNGNGNKK